MGKLIDLDAVLDILHLDPGIATEQERMIKELPEAVIRCKACLMHGVCRFERGLGLDGYCSQAERRTDEPDDIFE